MATEPIWRMNRAQLRSQLEARREHLTEDLQRLKERIREHGSKPPLAEMEDDIDEGDLDASLIDIANSTLRRIDHALERLRVGSYGRCTRCRRAIAEARLAAMPFAVRCHQCESARERTSRAARSTYRTRPWAEGSP